MRSLFLILVLINLVVLAAQFEPVRELILQDSQPSPRPSLNPEKLRIIRDTSGLYRPPAPAPSAPPDAVADQPTSGTKN